ncbi:putative nuclease like [Trypanosoma vivax]|nr:micrococcal nuclease [Trypanosoma vivax]KAH8613126.1 putative nuclease like [Trypanosoma vivax]
MGFLSRRSSVSKSCIEQTRQVVDDFFKKKRLSTFAEAPKGDLLEEHTLKNLDGNLTFFLKGSDHVRVRLLGISIPGSILRTCFGVCQTLCPVGCHVTVQYVGFETCDKAGRQAYIFAPHMNGKEVICVNLALLEMGYAHVFVLRSSPLGNISALMSAQNSARGKKRGMWSEVDQKKQVIVAKDSDVFHSTSCSSAPKDGEVMTISKALDEMYSQCRFCLVLHK